MVAMEAAFTLRATKRSIPWSIFGFSHITALDLESQGRERIEPAQKVRTSPF
jgi:hypothetical protein